MLLYLMDGVLNEVTNTVHKHQPDESDLESRCGATRGLGREQLRMTNVTRALSETSADKCGRCFDDAGGY